jgi:hypothetical protein
MCCKFQRRGGTAPGESVICKKCRQLLESNLANYNYGADIAVGFEEVLVVEQRIHDLLLPNADDADLLDAFIQTVTWANLNRPANHVHQAEVVRQQHPELIVDLMRRALHQGTRTHESLQILDEIPRVGFATATKILMFSDPIHYPVLDSKIARWIEYHIPSVFKWTGTPLSSALSSAESNRYEYCCWCELTREVAQAMNVAGSHPTYTPVVGEPIPEIWRASDVERAVFQQMTA